MICPCGCLQPVKEGNRYATRSCANKCRDKGKASEASRLAWSRKPREARVEATRKAVAASNATYAARRRKKHPEWLRGFEAGRQLEYDKWKRWMKKMGRAA